MTLLVSKMLLENGLVRHFKEMVVYQGRPSKDLSLFSSGERSDSTYYSSPSLILGHPRNHLDIDGNLTKNKRTNCIKWYTK
jgi:hypothetical protein